jgi:hypothetical protein
LPIARPAGVPTPCHKCARIPAGELPIRDNAIELSDRNWRAYEHFLECRAVGLWPDDPIVKRNARILREIHDEAERRPLLHLIAILGMQHVRGGA